MDFGWTGDQNGFSLPRPFFFFFLLEDSSLRSALGFLVLLPFAGHVGGRGWVFAGLDVIDLERRFGGLFSGRQDGVGGANRLDDRVGIGGGCVAGSVDNLDADACAFTGSLHLQRSGGGLIAARRLVGAGGRNGSGEARTACLDLSRP